MACSFTCIPCVSTMAISAIRKTIFEYMITYIIRLRLDRFTSLLIKPDWRLRRQLNPHKMNRTNFSHSFPIDFSQYPNHLWPLRPCCVKWFIYSVQKSRWKLEINSAYLLITKIYIAICSSNRFDANELGIHLITNTYYWIDSHQQNWNTYFLIECDNSRMARMSVCVVFFSCYSVHTNNTNIDECSERTLVFRTHDVENRKW